MTDAGQADNEGGAAKKLCRTCVDFKTWMRQKKEKFVGPGNTEAPGTSDSGPPTTQSDSSSGPAAGSPHPSPMPDPMEVPPPNCPLDKDGLGVASWGFLHTMAGHYPDKPTRQQQSDMSDFIRLFSKFYPCDPCAEDMRKDLAKSPPQTSSALALSRWFCELHNGVNRKMHKPQFDCSLVLQRWRDGWDDGSCD